MHLSVSRASGQDVVFWYLFLLLVNQSFKKSDKVSVLFSGSLTISVYSGHRLIKILRFS